MKQAIYSVLVFAACGGGDEAPADSATGTDAQVAAVEVVTPCAGETSTITTLGTRFDPAMVTIAPGQIVKFVSEATHPVAALPGTDPALAVPEGQTKCFKFPTAGTYNFKCTFHSFVGKITVQ